MADGVGGCEALVCTLLSVPPDIPNAYDLILRAAVATTYLTEHDSLRYSTARDAQYMNISHVDLGVCFFRSDMASFNLPHSENVTHIFQKFILLNFVLLHYV